MYVVKEYQYLNIFLNVFIEGVRRELPATGISEATDCSSARRHFEGNLNDLDYLSYLCLRTSPPSLSKNR